MGCRVDGVSLIHTNSRYIIQTSSENSQGLILRFVKATSSRVCTSRCTPGFARRSLKFSHLALSQDIVRLCTKDIVSNLSNIELKSTDMTCCSRSAEFRSKIMVRLFIVLGEITMLPCPYQTSRGQWAFI
jgi:hypothetical protein